MHRTLHRPQALLMGGLLLGLLCVPAVPAAAQVPAPTSNPIIVPAGTKRNFLQMTTKKEIKTITNNRENVLTFKKVEGDPTKVELVPGEAGVAHLTLTDVDGHVETVDVIVQADVEFLRIQLHRLAPTANIEPIPVSNSLIVLRGTVNHIDDVARLTNAAVAAMPGIQIYSELQVAGVQQVQLCVTVAQVSRSQFRSMAFDFLTNSKNFFFGSTVGQAVAEPALVGTGGTLNATLLGQTLSGIPGAPSGNPTNLLFGVIHNRWGFLGFLEALRTEGVVKTLNEPTVTTMSGRPASFLVGGEQAVPVPAGLGQVGVQFEEFGTRLNVIPVVMGNGKIHLEIEPEVSELNAANGTSIDGVVVPGRTTTRINTTVELEDGQTFVLGGLVQKDITGQTIKTPVLGDVPFLGTFFSSKSFNEDETEVVVLVTPHLVDAEDCAQAPRILPGEETRRPDDFELFLEGILEAPRGPRQVFEDHRYIAPYKNSPTAAMFPCAGEGGCNGACNGGCNGGCATCGAPAVATPPAVVGANPLPPAPVSLSPMQPAQPAAAPASLSPTQAADPVPAPTAPVMPPAPADTSAAPAAPPADIAAPPAPLSPPAPSETTPAAPGQGSAPPANLPPAPPAPGDEPK